MSLALSALGWLFKQLLAPFSWFLLGRASGRTQRAEKALGQAQKAQRIDDEVAALDGAALDDSLRADRE